jgi:Flp pilus assembly protein TadG
MRSLFFHVVSTDSSAIQPRPGRTHRAGKRRGAAVVEFAIVAPILFLVVILPTFEFGRGLMVAELVTNAARAGCRVGILPGNTNSTVTTSVANALSSQGISSITTTVKVNGTVADVNTAAVGDTIMVTVSVPYNANSWIPGRFLAGTNISGTQTMRRE